MTNIIHSTFVHGARFKIGHYCVIEEDVVVGNDVTIENYVLLKKGTRVGDNVFIDSYFRSSGVNRIGDNVTLRYGTTLAKEVVVEDDVFISPNVMTIYSSPRTAKKSQTIIKKGAYIGTAAVVGPGVIIGNDVVLGAMSFANRNCEVPGIYVGVPARIIDKKENK